MSESDLNTKHLMTNASNTRPNTVNGYVHAIGARNIKSRVLIRFEIKAQPFQHMQGK
jgi:hypothetical protein